MDIKNELKNFAEDNKSEMSVNVYNGIWNIIQSIEHEETKLFGMKIKTDAKLKEGEFRLEYDCGCSK